MRYLFLDDDQDRHDAFAKRFDGHVRTHVYTVDEFADAVSTGRYDVVCLDHDLGDYVYGMYGIEAERTGYDAAKCLAAAGWSPDHVILHSWNPDGAKRMLTVLRQAGMIVIVQPFSFTAEG